MQPVHFDQQHASAVGAPTNVDVYVVPSDPIEGAPGTGTTERFHLKTLQIETDSAAEVDVIVENIPGGSGTAVHLFQGAVSAGAPINLGEDEGESGDIGGISLAATDVLRVVLPQTAAVQQFWINGDGDLE